MKNIFAPFLFVAFSLLGGVSLAQTPVYPNPLTGICSPAVPHFNVNLSGVPDSIWISPNVTRQPTCCGDPLTGNWTFVSFTVTLDPNVAEVAVGLSPSDPGGASSGYWIDVCGSYANRIEGGTEVCITGPGPHNFWYGKSGGNANSSYTIVQIPKPTFPADDSVRIGCSLPLNIYGLNNIIMTSGNSTYDSWLDMTDPNNPIFTPGSTAPAFIDYTISGTQIASASCGAYPTSDVVRIYIYQPLDITVTPNPANFCEGGNVSLLASVSNPFGTLEYSWIDNATNTEISSISSTPPISVAGNYTVYVSDILNRFGCAPSGITRYVGENLAPVVSAGNDDTVCSSNPKAYPVASVTNLGSGILWSSTTGGTFDDPTSFFPEYTASAFDLTNGFVDLTVTAFGCQDDNDVVRIYFNNGPQYNLTTPSILCHDSTVSVSVNVTSGAGAPWAPISYYWSVNSSAGLSSIELGAGSYSVTVMNSYGCGSNTAFTLNEPNALTIVMSNTDANPLGSVTATVGGGTPGYIYSWENSLGTPMGNTSTIAGLTTDYYVATVTDNNGCVITGSTVVNDPSCASFDASVIGTDVLCFDDKTGLATVTSVSGGSGNYDYLWLTHPNQNNITATGLGAGVYEVVVTDNVLGCLDIAIAVVSEPTQLSNSMTHTDNTVIGGTSGTATANPSGGTAPYDYSWNTVPAQFTQTAHNLPAGTYTVNITDDNGCMITDNVKINEPPCNNFQAAVITNDISCNGLTDGSATVLVAHGTAPYLFSLDGGIFLSNPTAQFTNLSGGAHTLSIMDAQECVVIQNFFIDEPSALSIGLSPNHIICYEQTNGTIDLSIAGGTYPFSFIWINNTAGNLQFATTEDVIGLGVGTYSVKVIDANGCVVNASTGIDQPDEIVTTYTVTDITCYGADNGAIDATISGGQTPYSYSWIYPTGTSNTQDLSGLSPGQYLLTVSDANNCSKNNIVNLYMNEPQQVTIHSSIVNCPIPGANTTVVEVDSITGGTEGLYTLSFDGGAPLTAGIYSTSLTIGATHTVTATDANACTVTAPTSIVINPAVTSNGVNLPLCVTPGSPTMTIEVLPIGGDGGPYQISTNNGTTFNTEGTYILSVPVGSNYQIVIEDTSNCRSIPYNLSIPNEVTVNITADSVNCLNGNDGSIIVSANGGVVPYQVSWTGPSSGNPVGNEITIMGGSYTLSSLTAGTYAVTVIDLFGCSKVVNVVVGTTIDLINPTISCPGSFTTNTDLNSCFDNVIYGTPVGTDNCPGSITTQTVGLASGSNFSTGITTNTFLVTDAQGRTATCSFNITVVDTQLPTIICPTDVTVTADAGDCFADFTSVSLGTPTTNDNCAVASVVNDAPATFPVGTTTVTWTITDANGNMETCEQDVIVTDDEFPVITTCPATVNVNADNGSCFATNVNLGTPVATDNCSVSTLTNNAPGAFSVGTTVVTWTVTDVNGNSVTCLQNVIVTDNQLPVIVCPANITEHNNPTICGSNTISLGTPFTSDNCNVNTVSNDAPAFFPIGTTTVTWTVTDVNGNSAQCTQNVTIIDNELPVVTLCPADINTTTDPNDCFINSANVNLVAPTVTDNCGIATITSDAPASFNVGTTTVTWTVTDVNGNMETCEQDVIVTDDELPIITTCPATVNVNADNGSCFATNVNLGTPVATDNCTVSTLTNNAPGAFSVGTTFVTWTVTDVNGNSVTCLQNVIVTDNQNPVIICNAAITQSNDNGACGSSTVLLVTPSTFDNCSVDLITNDAPTFFPIGTTTVTWTVTDVNGNSAQCTQDIIINDDENPVIVTCVLDQTVIANNSCEYALVDYTASIVATDNCGYTISQLPITGTLITTGTTNVVITVMDNVGNTATCNFDVTVEDTLSPVISGCPSDIIANTDLGVCGAIVNWTIPTAADNCGVTFISNHNSGVLFPVGTTTVTYTATDLAGNISLCSFDVTITDNEAPTVLTCQSNIGSCDSLVAFSAPTAADNCSVSTITQTSGLPSGSIFPLGTTNVIYTITDRNGNISTCSFDVTIHPTPEITFVATNVTCNGFENGMIDITVNSGTSPFTFDWLNNANTEDLDSLAPGNYSVTVMDTFGCKSSINTSIAEPEKLSLSETHEAADCYGNNTGSIDVSISGGIPSYSYDWSNSSTDEDMYTLFSGSYEVIVADANGCLDSLTIEITQPDSLELTAVTTSATCSGSDGTLDVTVMGGNGNYQYDWTGGVMTEDLVDYPAGTYSVTVTDDKGCALIYTDSIDSKSYISVIDKLTDVICFGNTTGAIDIYVLNGTSPYTFTWSNGDTTEDIADLTAGLYTVTVTDSNLCTITMNYLINEPTILEVILNSPIVGNGFNVSSYGGNNGEIELTVNGGLPPYSILWVETSDTVANLYSLFAGTYNVIVTDENGCMVTDKIILSEPFELAMPTGYSPNGDGANDYFVVKGIEAFPDNEIQVYNRWGNIVYKESGYQNRWNGTNTGGDELPDGTYFVVLVLNGIDIEPLSGYVDLRRTR